MKIKSVLAAVFLALIAVGSVFSQAKSKSLVVYFSRAEENVSVGTIQEGNTAILAKIVASKTGADIFEIIPEKDYPKTYKECADLAKKEQRENARPAYKGNIDTSLYDIIYIGYPIWWGDLPMTLYTFLESHDLSGKTIVPFCTHEGTGLNGTDAKIKKLYKNVTMKTALSMKGAKAQKKREQAEKDIDAWLKKNGL